SGPPLFISLTLSPFLVGFRGSTPDRVGHRQSLLAGLQEIACTLFPRATCGRRSASSEVYSVPPGRRARGTACRDHTWLVYCSSGDRNTLVGCLASDIFRVIRSAACSAIMVTGMFVLPRGTVGMTDASATLRPSMPWTEQSTSTTEPGSSALPV